MSKLYLIDGHAYIHRAYHALPPLTTSRGEMVNALYGFIRLILKIIRQEKPEYLAICFDYPAPTFRHIAYAPYKAHRKIMDDELKSQMPLARDAVRALNIKMVEKQGFEADDIIATLARAAKNDGADVVIVTGDKDILQIVDSKINVLNEHKNILFNTDKVIEKYGVEPARLVDIFSLSGDASDNIPGAKGIGEKTAFKLIKEYGSVENLLARVDSLEGKLKDKIVQSTEDILRSKMLVTLRDDVPLDISWKDTLYCIPDEKTAIDFLKHFEFTTLINEIFPENKTVKNSPAVESSFNAHVVLDKNDLSNLTANLQKADRIAFDIEYDSPDPFNSKIAGIAFACTETDSYYIPLGHSYEGAPVQLPLDETLNTLKPIFQGQKIKKCGQDIKQSLLVLKMRGITLKGIYFDTMVASYCLNPSKINHTLKNTALDYMSQRLISKEDLTGAGSKQISINEIEIEKTANLACAQTIMVLKLTDKLESQLKEKKLEPLFFDIEAPLIEILADMEQTGMKVDITFLSGLAIKFTSMMQDIEKEIFRMAEQEFNPNSTKQLAFILFEKLKLPVIKKTKTGYSTDEAVLRALAPCHSLPAKLIAYRELQKLKSTYIDGIIARTDPENNRVHTSLNQAVTATGRLSSSDPNLQNIPVRTEYGREIRRAFISENEYMLLSADYSQIDLRVLAHISQDAMLIDAFNKSEDVHTATASEVFGVALSSVTPEQRRIAKTINFGIVYGMSPFGLSQQLSIPQHQAKEYIERYFNKYSGVQKWIENIIKETCAKGYVTTLTGRIRYLPEINSSNSQVRKFSERMAMNTPVQGTSADIIKIAMIRLYRKLTDGGYETKMIMQVHDELLFDVPEKEVGSVAPVIKQTMEEAMRLDVALRADIKIGRNWSDLEAHETVIISE